MELVIGIILIIVTLLIVGLIFRKRVYDAVDRLEIWKMDILNRNTASQLARMKGLNLSGEAQEKFESWRERWEYIVTKELPDVEDYLFKAEELADKYRFPSAHKILHKIDENLTEIEANIEDMLAELDELLLSEKESKEKIESLKPVIDELRKKLIYHRYQYGNADRYFEAEFEQFKQQLDSYHDLVEAGDYTKAKDLVDQLADEIEVVAGKMYELPEILKLCTSHLPNQLDDLSSGIQQMKQEGYRIAGLGLEDDIEKLSIRLQDCVKSLEQGNISEVKQIVSEIDEEIEEMYDVLEKEAIAKNYIETKLGGYEQTLNELGASFDHTRTEVEELKKTYYFEDRDMESFLVIEKAINQAKTQLDELSEKLHNEDISHTELREQLESGFRQLEELQEQHEEFKQQIHNLRKDELAAKEKLRTMTEQINALHRKLQRSNIPGVPNYIWTLMENAANKNSRVMTVLEKHPLDIGEVQQALNEAETSINQAVDEIDKMLEQAYLTELVIQYANRYRSQYPLLAARLSESERLFRSYEYELSLEQAAEALEEIEPGALQHIEANQKVL